MFQLKAAIKLNRPEALARLRAQPERGSGKRHASALLSDVSKNLLVVSARVFFLSFPKWYVIRNAADSGVSSRILLSDLDRHANGSHRNAARPIKFDIPCANILFGFLHGIRRIPTRFRGNATSGSQRQNENAQGRMFQFRKPNEKCPQVLAPEDLNSTYPPRTSTFRRPAFPKRRDTCRDH